MLAAFHSDACFAALLGRPEHGHWSIRPANVPSSGVTAVSRCYQQDTLILETELAGTDGSIRLIDFMAVGGDAASLVRIVHGVRDETLVRMELDLRFGYGALPPWTEPIADGAVARVGPIWPSCAPRSPSRSVIAPARQYSKLQRDSVWRLCCATAVRPHRRPVRWTLKRRSSPRRRSGGNGSIASMTLARAGRKRCADPF